MRMYSAALVHDPDLLFTLISIEKKQHGCAFSADLMTLQHREEGDSAALSRASPTVSGMRLQSMAKRCDSAGQHRPMTDYRN